MDEKQKPAVDIEELKSRVKEFQGELIPLLGKYKIGIGAQPFVAPDGRLLAKPTFFDDSASKPPEPAIQTP